MVLVGSAPVVSCRVRGDGVIVITFTIVVTGTIVSQSDVVTFTVDGAYYAAVVEDRTAVSKLRRLRSCMIRINNIQRVVSSDKSGCV